MGLDRVRVLLLSWAIVAGTTAPAHAQVPPPPAPPASPASPPPAAAPVNAAAESTAGDRAAKAKDFAGALAHYQASVQAGPTAHAQLAVADALYELGRAAEAYTAYSDAQQTYGAKLTGGDKTTLTGRLKELASKTGTLSIHVEDSGADVSLDGKSIGTSPMAALQRVASGPHEVRVTRTGFLPFVGQAEVPADGKATVDVSPLTAQPTRGHVLVRAPGSEPLRVIVDGLDLGATPWEGDLPAGTHEITGRSSTQSASAQTVSLAVGDSVTIDLVSATTAAHLQVRTTDGKGTVYVDGVNKGTGGFAGDVTPGAHTLVVESPGFERFEKTVTLGERETWAETITLKAAQVAITGAMATPERAYEGVYGGFGLVALFGVGGQGTDLDTHCDGLGASSCDTGQPIGGALFGYVGYTWNPVGFELMLAGEGDSLGETAHFANTGQNSSSPIALPPRDEKFRYVRAGGLAALRVRASIQGKWVRGTIAGGLGLSYKAMFMKRDTNTTDGTNRVDVFAPDSVSYFSPAITAEAAAHFRITPTVSVALGLEMWADNASIGGSTTTAPSHDRFVGGGTPGSVPQPVATPAYQLASGPQVFLAPFLGMQFGP